MKSTATAASETSINKLEEAFEIFNQVSADLGTSYRGLETRITGLSKELAASNSARIRELTEKEQLAAKLSALMDALPGGVITLDPTGIVKDENPVALQIMGQSFQGYSWEYVMDTTASMKPVFDGEVSFPDGIRVSITSSPYGDNGDTIILLTDITENFRLNNLINREKRLAALGEMAARLAHQVRTPLSSAILYLSHLSFSSTSSENDNTQVTNNIRNRLRQIEKLVDGMLSYIRGDINANQTFSPAQLLREVNEATALQLKEANGTLTIAATDIDFTVNGDREALFNAVLNLVENSIQAVEKNPHISLSLTRDEDYVRFSVADNGPGIDESIRENVFDPFFSTRTGGTGLGLAVVLSAVTTHRGNISLDCPKSGGSIFTLSIPCQQDSLREELGIWVCEPQ